MTEMEDKALAMLKKAHKESDADIERLYGRDPMAKTNADIVGTASSISFHIDGKKLTVWRFGDNWFWRVMDIKHTLALTEDGLPDIYTAIEKGKEWIAHAKG